MDEPISFGSCPAALRKTADREDDSGEADQGGRDFGEGRKLERFGMHLLDRPSAVAEGKPKSHSDQWSAATARYDRTGPDQGEWRPMSALDQSWSIRHESVIFQLKGSPFGHIGVFPEQAHNWDWIARHVARFGRPIKVLNLFAYTGGSTLAAAQAGIPTTAYAATQVKKILTGAGRAPKSQMQIAIQRELGLPELPEPDDVADALAVALCHHYLSKTVGAVALASRR